MKKYARNNALQPHHFTTKLKIDNKTKVGNNIMTFINFSDFNCKEGWLSIVASVEDARVLPVFISTPISLADLKTLVKDAQALIRFMEANQ